MPREIDLKYERAEGYRNVVVDNATTIALSDAAGVRMFASFTRIETVPISEKAIEMDGGGVGLIPGSLPVTEPRKTLEVTLEMRPDTVLAIANALFKALEGLGQPYKNLYGIPDKLPQAQPIPPRLPQ